ncbi:MAG: ABC transporter ATP-binding protein [Candidatus Dormibacteraeota bacterium]|nr:ABC transporter ATP-binding protein [Candidatus Dormibacteraeota bacterium]
MAAPLSRVETVGERDFGAEIRVSGLLHAYGEAGRLPVLRGVDLDVEPGGYLAITGVSGAGKSTLLALLGGLESVQSGSVMVGGRNLASLNGRELAHFRRDVIGFVFQDFGLLGMLTALENVEMALSLAGVSRAERRRRAAELLAEVGLAGRASHRPTALSGGELQRVAIARALANRPQLVLADEPTGNLDEDSALRVLELLERLRAERGCTLVVVTHNQELAERAGRRVRLTRGTLQ